ncbi:uncharacterized protein FOMMEDRAFT_162216 [Fomitiporia mediterranea MF3/22]|uniref:uncharacterized protein n=1 Tax=Fomitiporia mediterranea (strain MF3/22) TaxID=694068 RepID=UPI0004408D45|nr:uncharacterized protein FOMMEDRAFT_162216 [Fomitiporia mediterranea MF3/22]EJC97877.1 hypothetical protein FOMMEDRAFT_162216 [Fomitiporia mediterranea MF3/22]
MPSDSDVFVLPENYTFTLDGVVIHKDAFARLVKLLEKAKDRDPGMHDMYVYEDFFGYGVLELIDETLYTIHEYVSKKKWLVAWHALDALAKFKEMLTGWLCIDDGEHVRATEQAFGAFLIATLRELEAAGQLSEETIPGLEDSLKEMTEFAEAWWETLDTCYHKVLKGYGKKLFGERTQAEREHIYDAHRKAYIEFVKGLSEAERRKRDDDIDEKKCEEDEDEDEDDDEDDEEEGEDRSVEGGQTVWYGNADAQDANFQDPTFRLKPAMKGLLTYKPKASSGPSYYDLTKWTEEEKMQYVY